MCSNNENQKCSNPVATDELISRFLKKNVIYILGQLDNGTPDGSPEANDDLDTSCGSNFQGPDRLSRGTSYYESLDEFGPHNHRLMIAPQIGHSSSRIYGSYQALTSVFGGDLPKKEYIAPLYKIRSELKDRFLDVSNVSPRAVIMNKAEKSTAQDWIISKAGPNEYRIQHQETLLYLEASEQNDYSVSLANYRSASAQIWILKPVANKSGIYTLQQKSSLRFLKGEATTTNQGDGGEFSIGSL
ncbi:MAG: RICIN domain-containing protein [Bdellovibrionia bacterium]